MTISRAEAAQALSDIDTTTGRSRTFGAYRVTGPILMLWGVIWALGYTGMGLWPIERWGVVWGVLDVVGVALTILLARRRSGTAAATAASSVAAWRGLATALVIMLFLGASFAIFQPTDQNAYMTFPVVLAGFIYAGIGIQRMPRLIWIGAAMAGIALIGFYAFQPILPFWLAVVGGGGLLAGGLWLRSA